MSAMQKRGKNTFLPCIQADLVTVWSALPAAGLFDQEIAEGDNAP